MKPVDYRNERWADVERRVQGDRAMVYWAMLDAGPCTTRHLAELMGWDLLNVRPRVTELCQLGLARVVGGEHGEGCYEAVKMFQAKHEFDERKREAMNDQLLLKM